MYMLLYRRTQVCPAAACVRMPMSMHAASWLIPCPAGSSHCCLLSPLVGVLCSATSSLGALATDSMLG